MSFRFWLNNPKFFVLHSLLWILYHGSTESLWCHPKLHPEKLPIKNQPDPKHCHLTSLNYRMSKALKYFLKQISISFDHWVEYFNIFGFKNFLIGFVAKCTKFYGQTQRARNKYWLCIGSIYFVNPYKCTIQTYFVSYLLACTDLAAFGDIQCPQEGEARRKRKASAIKRAVFRHLLC